MPDTVSRDITFQVRPIGGHMAAEVIGLDLSEPFDDATLKAVRDAFLTHQILAFRNQDLDKDQQVTFTQQFGTLERHTLSNRGTNSHPQVHTVTNLDDQGRPTGTVGSGQWHSDKSFRPEPSMATVLHAKMLPPQGGDTLFANLYAAYDHLPDAEKSALDGLMVVHSWEHSRANIGRTLSAEEIADAPPSTHPLVRVHPETGRKALFIGMHASHIEGMDQMEGRRRIEALEDHATQPRYVYRHQWQPGDILMWDNRCLMHRADPNFDAKAHRRVLHRTCLRGTATR